MAARPDISGQTDVHFTIFQAARNALFLKNEML
jgi:hypothetical protein